MGGGHISRNPLMLPCSALIRDPRFLELTLKGPLFLHSEKHSSFGILTRSSHSLVWAGMGDLYRPRNPPRPSLPPSSVRRSRSGGSDSRRLVGTAATVRSGRPGGRVRLPDRRHAKTDKFCDQCQILVCSTHKPRS